MVILYVAFIFPKFAFAYVLYIVFYSLLFKTNDYVTLKKDIKILLKLSILCYKVVAGNYNKLKQTFTKYRNNSFILMTAKLFQASPHEKLKYLKTEKIN